jgi:carbon monoxide dehydrogenase subunit G
MIIVGSRTVAAPREGLWEVLSDPARLAQSLPGVEAVSVDDERHFSAVARPRTALGETRLALEFEILEQRASEYVRIGAGGSAGEGLVAFTIELSLEQQGAETQASWRADVALRGVMRSLLQRSLAPLFNQQVEDVLEAGARISEGAGGS